MEVDDFITPWQEDNRNPLLDKKLNNKPKVEPVKPEVKIVTKTDP